MFDERANPEATKGFAERLLVVALVGGERPQIARVPAGDLLGEIRVTSFPVRRTMYVKNGLRVCIDGFRDLQLLYAVADSLAVVATRS
jgi:plasmid stabilization system protein ParE